MDALDDLLKHLPGFSTLTVGMKRSALSQALIPDSSGVWPGRPGYVETHDVYFAAIVLSGFLRAQPVVTTASSEETSVTVSHPGWEPLLRYFRSMSPIVKATGQEVFGVIQLPGYSYQRADMSGRDSDIDTDVN